MSQLHIYITVRINTHRMIHGCLKVDPVLPAFPLKHVPEQWGDIPLRLDSTQHMRCTGGRGGGFWDGSHGVILISEVSDVAVSLRNASCFFSEPGAVEGVSERLEEITSLGHSHKNPSVRR